MLEYNLFGFYVDQDPAAPRFSEAFRDNVQEILMERYRLLPFLYTLMHVASSTGGTVARPLLNEFVSDSTTHDIDTQFLWGPALLISPALNEGQTIVRAYTPEGRWYSYFTGEEVLGSLQFYDFDTPLDKINVHVRGGYILPLQEPAVTTELSLTNQSSILVALGVEPGYEASGSLYWDDGITFGSYEKGSYVLYEFSAARETNNGPIMISSSLIHDGYAGSDDLVFQTVTVDGLPNPPVSIRINEAPHFDYTYNFATNRLLINNIAIGFKIPFNILID